MRVELLVSEWCPSCHQAEKIWREASQERDFEFAVVDMAQPEGRALASRLRLKTIPALIVDDELKGVGVQSLAEVRELVASAPLKAKSAMQFAGISMTVDNRYFVLASAVYLMLAGFGLVANGTLLTDGPSRPAVLHVFTVGFVVLFIYGLGAHMLPRFTGNPIRRGGWPWAQMGLAHAGLLGCAAGSLGQVHALVVAGGFLIWLSLLVFALRIWPVLWPKGTAGQRESGIQLRGLD